MNIKFIGSFLCFVEVTGLEPATAWSQTRNATNCATPRLQDPRKAALSVLRVQRYKLFLSLANILSIIL